MFNDNKPKRKTTAAILIFAVGSKVKTLKVPLFFQFEIFAIRYKDLSSLFYQRNFISRAFVVKE